MNKPLVSIIIPTWNTADTTSKCVETIFQHYSPKSVEVIVIDNGSTDHTAQLLSHLPHLKYFHHPENLGYGKACNLGASQATANVFLFLNSDMEFIDRQLFSALKYYSQHPQVGIIAPQFLNPDKSRQGSCFRDQSYQNAFLEFWRGIPVYQKYTPSSSQPSAVWAVSGGAILISRQLFKQVGGWNPKYFMFYEDLELCRDVRQQQRLIVYFPQWQLVHRHGLSGRHLAPPPHQWRRLIKSSRLYHGLFKHYLLNFIIWSGQKWQKYTKLLFS